MDLNNKNQKVYPLFIIRRSNVIKIPNANPHVIIRNPKTIHSIPKFFAEILIRGSIHKGKQAFDERIIQIVPNTNNITRNIEIDSIYICSLSKQKTSLRTRHYKKKSKFWTEMQKNRLESIPYGFFQTVLNLLGYSVAK
jgi:hypothetical protein